MNVHNPLNNLQTWRSTERSASPLETQPNYRAEATAGPINDNEVALAERCELLQNFIVEKGLIDPTLSNTDLWKSLDAIDGARRKSSKDKPSDEEVSFNLQQNMQADNCKDKSAGKSVNCGSSTSASEVTVYQRVVRQDVNTASNQIDDFLNKVHSDTLLQSNYDNRKLSSSSGYGHE